MRKERLEELMREDAIGGHEHEEGPCQLKTRLQAGRRMRMCATRFPLSSRRCARALRIAGWSFPLLPIRPKWR